MPIVRTISSPIVVACCVWANRRRVFKQSAHFKGIEEQTIVSVIVFATGIVVNRHVEIVPWHFICEKFVARVELSEIVK